MTAGNTHGARDLVGGTRPTHRHCVTASSSRIAGVQRELERFVARTHSGYRAQIVQQARRSRDWRSLVRLASYPDS